MTLRIVIADDEPRAALGLMDLCQRSDRVTVVGFARTGAEAIALVNDTAPDALLLDIGMPGMDGMAVARKLNSYDDPPLVAFVTAHDHFAAEAFDLSVVDYLLKPVEAARFERAIDRLVDRARGRSELAGPQPVQAFWAPRLGRMVRVAVRDIQQIEAERDYVRLVTAGGSYLLRQPISVVETRLDPAQFIRLHRSTIARLDRVTALKSLGAGSWAAIDRDGHALRIGRSHLSAVRAKLGL